MAFSKRFYSLSLLSSVFAGPALMDGANDRDEYFKMVEGGDQDNVAMDLVGQAWNAAYEGADMAAEWASNEAEMAYGEQIGLGWAINMWAMDMFDIELHPETIEDFNEVFSFDFEKGAIQFKFGTDYEEISGYLEIPYWPTSVNRDDMGSFDGNRKISAHWYGYEYHPQNEVITWEHWQPVKTGFEVNVDHGEKYNYFMDAATGEFSGNAEIYFDIDYQMSSIFVKQQFGDDDKKDEMMKRKKRDHDSDIPVVDKNYEQDDWKTNDPIIIDQETIENSINFDDPIWKEYGNAKINGKADDVDAEITIELAHNSDYLAENYGEFNFNFVEKIEYANCEDYFYNWWETTLDEQSKCKSNYVLDMNQGTGGWYFKQNSKTVFKENFFMTKWDVETGMPGNEWWDGYEDKSNGMFYLRGETKNKNLNSFNDCLYFGAFMVNDLEKSVPSYINQGQGDLVLRFPGVQGFQQFVYPILEAKMEKYWNQLVQPIIESEDPMKTAFMMFYWFDQAVAGTVKKRSFDFSDVWAATKINSDVIGFLQKREMMDMMENINYEIRSMMRDMANDEDNMFRQMRRTMNEMAQSKKVAKQLFSFQ